MFNSIALDVVIGLTFVFLLYSLFASILQEIIAKYLQLRALMLGKAIRRLLQDSDFTNRRSLVGRLFAGRKALNEKLDFVNQFYEYPTIKYLGEGSFYRRPAYINAGTYAEVIVRILRGLQYTGIENQLELIKQNLSDPLGVPVRKKFEPRSGRFADSIKKKFSDKVTVALLKSPTDIEPIRLSIDRETKTMLMQMVYESHNDIDKFRTKLEDSFNEMMERAEGWYKKQTRLILFLIGLFLAVSFNVDTIKISTILIKNKQVRDLVVEKAIEGNKSLSKIVKRPSTDTAYTQEQVADVTNNIGQINNILGASWGDWNGYTIPGWLVTALAISLGATFWFDLLQRLISIRQAGMKPEEKQDKSTDKTTTPNIVENKKIRVG
ncbi:hypothetical protein SAMN05660461_1379 [Chitinophaga ginsengisegetis]|uniref:Uncharacterized protein n=1 Tax=Chitinophaga ginsengisegetis TaxID=393003 RepID=A0A1T5NG07_9BACT|nr:hypothetical protein [Chitinophaga ginsengisegetis]SKC99133.1 hypothetical protein SAMN05660461_1379 [Chitinophaga ginsengisegetis]